MKGSLDLLTLCINIYFKKLICELLTSVLGYVVIDAHTLSNPHNSAMCRYYHYHQFIEEIQVV